MIKTYLLITIRNMMKNKLFILINIFGMGIAIATCIVGYSNWEFMAEWDKQHINSKSIYRVQFWNEFDGKRTRHGTSPMPLASYIKQNFREVDKTVRYMKSNCDIRIGDEVFGAVMAYADSAFFDLFTFHLKYGTFADFHDKTRVFISDEVARKYYNTEDVIGKPITQIVLGKDGIRRPKEFIVGGVFEKSPSNSSFQFELISLFDNFWDINLDPDLAEANWKKWTHALFLRIDDSSQVKGITQRLQQYIEPQNKVREDFKVSEYYLENFYGAMQRNGANPPLESDYLSAGLPDEAVTVPGMMALMLLLLACFNFTNTSIAISSRRLKEIGIRKVIGGMRRQLILQFMGENLLLCFLGLLAGLLLAEWLAPAYDSLWNWLDLKLDYIDNIGFMAFLVGLLILTAVIAGAYPSFYITSFEPVSILKGHAKLGGTSWFTRMLLGGQFVISLLCIIMAVAFYNNGVYQREYDLGYATHGVISAWVNNEGMYNTYRDALATNKDIQVIAGTRNHLATSTSWYNDPVKYDAITKEVDIMEVGDNYFEVMDMTLLSGRKFAKNSETDRKESVIVSEEFVKQFQWKDGFIGKRVVWMDTVQLFVIGVIKNVYARALWKPVQPMMIRYVTPEKYQQLVVKTDRAKVKEVNEFMEKKWKEVFPNSQYPGQLIDNKLQANDEINKNLVTMFGFLGFFAALMTGIGLFALVSLNIVRKTKEIGVRKVLGASIGNIGIVINKEFIVTISIAAVIGGGLGYLGSGWVMSVVWEYYEKLTPLSFLVSVVVIILIALLSVGYKTFAAASLNPTKTLRDE